MKFVLKHDHSGTAFRFAPLQGETFQARVPVDQRANLPMSVVVQTRDGALLMRSDACVHVLRRLGGGWKVIAALVAVVPRPLRDVVLRLRRAHPISRVRTARRSVPRLSRPACARDSIREGEGVRQFHMSGVRSA